MPERTYSEEEIAEIIKRAAEIESGQLSKKRPSGDLPGLSIEELSEIATEAGLDPENVRKAALQIDQPAVKKSSDTDGDEIFAEQWVKGGLTKEATDLAIADLNHRYGASHERESWRDNILNAGSGESAKKSTVQRTGKNVEWKVVDDYGSVSIRVLLQQRNRDIRIRVSKKSTWGTAFTDMDGDLFDYLSYIPYLAGFGLLISLPYSFFISAMVAIVAFTLLKLTLEPGARRLAKEMGYSESSTKGKRADRHRREVENIAEDLARLLGVPSSEPEGSSRIEIPDSDEKSQNSETRSGDTQEKDRG